MRAGGALTTDLPLRLDEPRYQAAVDELVERARSLGATDLVDAERQAVEMVEAAARHREHQRLVVGESWLATCPRRFAEADLDTLDQPPTVLGPLRAWADRARVGTGDNLVLVGPVGTGKTYTAVAVARELHFAGQPMRFVPAAELLEGLRPDGGDEVAAAVGPAILVLDDLGAERPTEWTADRLSLVLNRRWLDRSSTIVTTNLAGPALAELYGPRLHSRLADAATSLILGGPDRRRRPGGGA